MVRISETLTQRASHAIVFVRVQTILPGEQRSLVPWSPLLKSNDHNYYVLPFKASHVGSAPEAQEKSQSLLA